jgi:hypothetical protein
MGGVDEAPAVLDFWFDEVSLNERFAKDPALHRIIAGRSGTLRETVLASDATGWRDTSDRLLTAFHPARPISRNLYRGSAMAFAAKHYPSHKHAKLAKEIIVISGNCDCGAATYTIDTNDLHVYVCHCLNCQTRSGSAFAEHAMIDGSAFSIEGDLATYRREVPNMQFDEVVCKHCYTRLFNRINALPSMIFLRAGTLADSQRLEPMAHIWVKRKQSWILLADDIPVFQESPHAERIRGCDRFGQRSCDGSTAGGPLIALHRHGQSPTTRRPRSTSWVYTNPA